MKSDFQRIHIEKIVKGETKKTTVSIENLTYEFLCIKLEVEPHTRESHKKIRDWVTEKMRTDFSYDYEAPYLFSAWLKKIISWEITSREIKEKWKERIEV